MFFPPWVDLILHGRSEVSASHAKPEDFLIDSLSERASRSASEGQLMCAVIAVTINSAFAPVGRSASQCTRSEGWFVCNHSRQAPVTNRGMKEVVCCW